MICRILDRLLLGLLFFLPAIAAAHPGHYHPGEEDEFDQLRSDYFHLHGYVEIGLAALALTAFVVFHFHSNRRIRIGAALALGSSLILIAAL